MRRLLTAAGVLALTGTVLAGCEKPLEAPYDQGVCYYFAPGDEPGETHRFNVIATGMPQIEFCAARLEEMRLNFLRRGRFERELIGAYQGQFIFVEPRGVAFGKRLDGPRFIALYRSGDGRLVIPGAVQFTDPEAPAAPAE